MTNSKYAACKFTSLLWPCWPQKLKNVKKEKFYMLGYSVTSGENVFGFVFTQDAESQVILYAMLFHIYLVTGFGWVFCL